MTRRWHRVLCNIYPFRYTRQVEVKISYAELDHDFLRSNPRSFNEIRKKRYLERRNGSGAPQYGTTQHNNKGVHAVASVERIVDIAEIPLARPQTTKPNNELEMQRAWSLSRNIFSPCQNFILNEIFRRRLACSDGRFKSKHESCSSVHHYGYHEAERCPSWPVQDGELFLKSRKGLVARSDAAHSCS